MHSAYNTTDSLALAGNPLTTTDHQTVIIDDMVALLLASIKAMMMRIDVSCDSIDVYISNQSNGIEPFNSTALYTLPLSFKNNSNGDNRSSSKGSGNSDQSISFNNNKSKALINSWQDYLKAYLLQLLLSSSSSSTRKWSRFELSIREKLSSRLSLLSDQYPGVPNSIRAELRTNSGLLWKQKTWHRLFPQLYQHSTNSATSASEGNGSNGAIIDHTSFSSARTVSIIAICSLITDAPIPIIQSSIEELVHIVVFALTYVQSSSGASTTKALQLTTTQSLPTTEIVGFDTLSIDLLSTQSIATLELLLKHDASLFIPYLNVIIPSLIKVKMMTMMKILMILTIMTMPV